MVPTGKRLPYGTKPTRLGRQPFRHILRREHGWSLVYFAQKYGFSYPHVNGASSGAVRPSPELIDVLTELTGRPASGLFTPEALAVAGRERSPGPKPPTAGAETPARRTGKEQGRSTTALARGPATTSPT